MSYGKFIIYKKQISYDGGETWEDTDPLETTTSGDPVAIVDTFEECETATTFTGKYKFTLTDTPSTIIIVDCDSTSAITSGDTSNITSSIGKVEIGNCVTSIGNQTFRGCGNMIKCKMGNTLENIGNAAFLECYELRSIDIPNSVTSIGDSAFEYCSGATACTIGSGVTSIGDAAFRFCRSFSSVTIPNSVTTIGNNAFFDCLALQSFTCLATTPPAFHEYGIFNPNTTFPIYVPSASVNTYKTASGWSEYASRIQAISPEPTPPTNQKYRIVDIYGGESSGACDSSTELSEDELEENRTNFAYVEIGTCVTSLGGYVFSTCSSLSSVTIPNSVTSIGEGAFLYCASLNSVHIPSGVTNIDGYAFYRCSGLTSIRCDATTPPTIDSNTFEYTNDCPIYVPSASVNTYKAATNWSTYTSRIQAIP